MNITAKNATLIFDTKCVSFEIKKDVAYIDYYNASEFLYQLECPVHQANKIFKQCILEGYSESF